MSEWGLWNELLSRVGLKVWTMCLRWSWSSVEEREGKEGREDRRDRGRREEMEGERRREGIEQSRRVER